MWLFIAIIFLILFNFAFKTNSKNTRNQTAKDKQILQHTINVNLNILESEIVELSALIIVDGNQKASTAEQEEAKALLGKEIPILAWGQGMGRIITEYWKITDIRELYKNDVKQLREMKGWLR